MSPRGNTIQRFNTLNFSQTSRKNALAQEAAEDVVSQPSVQKKSQLLDKICKSINLNIAAKVGQRSAPNNNDIAAFHDALNKNHQYAELKKMQRREILNRSKFGSEDIFEACFAQTVNMPAQALNAT